MRVTRKRGWRRWQLLAVLAGSLGLLLLTFQHSARASATSSELAIVSPFSHVLSSGVFGLTTGAVSLDWIVLNDSPNTQQIRVTIYKVNPGGPKSVVAPGAVTANVAATGSYHNANNVGTVFTIGALYEVVVETNDTRVLPSVDLWSTNAAVIIPGMHLGPRDFSEVR